MSTVWVVQEEIPVALQLVPLDVKIFSKEEKARAYFKRELSSLKSYYDGPENDCVMPADVAVFASGEIRQIASVEKRQFGSAEIRQFESIEKSQS